MNKALILILLCGGLHAQVAIKGQKVYTMAGPVLENGLVLLEGKTIKWVGLQSEGQIPENYKVYEAAVVTPGLIDAHSVVGLAGYLNQRDDQDQLDGSSPIQPELRAIDAYNAQEPLVAWLREHGITTVHTGPAPRALVPGTTLIAKTVGDTVEAAIVKEEAMLVLTLGNAARAEKDKSPGTRGKQMAMLRGKFLKAQAYQKKLEGEKKPDRDLALETLVRALRGELPVMMTANRAQDIASALRLAEEFKLKLVLDGASEAYLMQAELKAAKIPVILHPTMQRAGGDAENMSMETAAILNREGLRVALQSGFEGYVPKTRVVLFEAAIAARYGLPFEAALATITVNAAEILGIADRVGTLEAGKDGDVALFDGDPFEYTSHVTRVFIHGDLASERVR